MTRSEILAKLTNLKPLLSNEYAVNEIGLFGSFADNSATDDSDVDLLVEFRRPIGWKYFSLEILLEKAFGRKIDLVTKSALKEQLRETILKQVTYV